MPRGVKESVLSEIARSGYWRAEDAEIVVAAWSRSGQSLAAFARDHGIHRDRLRRWKKRLESRDVPAFHPVRVVLGSEVEVRRAGSRGVPELVLRGGRRVSVPPDFDPEHLRQLVDVVESWTC